MAEVEFDFNGNKTIIQCGLNDKINNICQIYLNKINKDKNDVYFHIMEIPKIILMKN